jgi:hypothetical protein
MTADLSHYERLYTFAPSEFKPDCAAFSLHLNSESKEMSNM